MRYIRLKVTNRTLSNTFFYITEQRNVEENNYWKASNGFKINSVARPAYEKVRGEGDVLFVRGHMTDHDTDSVMVSNEIFHLILQAVEEYNEEGCPILEKIKLPEGLFVF